VHWPHSVFSLCINISGCPCVNQECKLKEIHVVVYYLLLLEIINHAI